MEEVKDDRRECDSLMQLILSRSSPPIASLNRKIEIGWEEDSSRSEDKPDESRELIWSTDETKRRGNHSTQESLPRSKAEDNI